MKKVLKLVENMELVALIFTISVSLVLVVLIDLIVGIEPLIFILMMIVIPETISIEMIVLMGIVHVLFTLLIYTFRVDKEKRNILERKRMEAIKELNKFK